MVYKKFSVIDLKIRHMPIVSLFNYRIAFVDIFLSYMRSDLKKHKIDFYRFLHSKRCGGRDSNPRIPSKPDLKYIIPL